MDQRWQELLAADTPSDQLAAWQALIEGSPDGLASQVEQALPDLLRDPSSELLERIVRGLRPALERDPAARRVVELLSRVPFQTVRTMALQALRGS